MQTLSTSTSNAMEAKRQLFGFIQAFWQSQCVYVATRLGIPNLVQQEAQSLERLAAITSTHADKLYVILRALAHLGVLEEQPGQVFAATELSDLLATNAGPSIGHFAMHITEPAQWDAWKQLEASLRTGEVPFERANGKTVYQYCQDNPWSGEVFVNAMSFLTDHAVDALLDVYDFSQFGTVMDVGGGQGGLIARIVQRSGCQGVLFDVPYVTAKASSYLKTLGIADDRLQIVAGDVFEAVPSGADAIVMKYFISAWNDDDARRILHNCRVALPPHGKIVLLQAFVPEIEDDKTAPDGIMPGLFAVQIMVAVPGGRWRTKQEFKTLFESCGFQLDRVIDTPTNLSAMEFSLANAV